MKTAIIYKSVFGTSKQYAEWLHESVESELYSIKQVNVDILRQHDNIVVCAGTYAGVLAFNGFLKKNLETLVNKKLVLVAVGMAPADDKASIRTYDSVPERIRKIAVYFKLPGKIGKDKKGLVKKENLTKVIEDIEKMRNNRIILTEVKQHEKSIYADASFRVVRVVA